MNRMITATINRVGPKPSRRDTSSDIVLVVDCALISTPWACSSAVSWSLFQNAGTSVANSVVAVAFESPAG